MKNKDLSFFITKYFMDYLAKEAGYSDNTIKSYRDTFVLLFRYFEDSKCIRLNKLNFENLNIENINNFLNWLEEIKGCAISSRNQRLAALKSFSGYVMREEPTQSFICKQILMIKSKKSKSKSVDYLTKEAIELLFKMPDIQVKGELRDLALITLLYESGARVQEIIDLKVADITFKEPNTVKLTGKGKKARIIPISKQATEIVKLYLKNAKISENITNVFKNKQVKPLSRSGVSYVLNKYVNKASKIDPILFNIKMHPHVLRHSKAMHLLENNVNLIYIRDFLGHCSVMTTEIYAKCNPEIKRKYIESASDIINSSIEGYSNEEKKTLLNWLKEYI